MVLVVWLVAAATGPQAYAAVQGAIASWVGQIVLFGCTFAFFLHLCGGIRHLVWDTVHGFELRSIYISGWAVVAASVVLTVAAWVASFVDGRVEPWTAEHALAAGPRDWARLGQRRASDIGGRSAFQRSPSCP